MVLATGACGNSPTEALSPRDPRTVVQLEPLRPGQSEFTLSAGLIEAPGKSVEVLAVRVLATPNITYLGAVTVWPRNRESSSETGIGFPHQGARTVHPAFGVVIPPAETGFVHPGERESRPVRVEGGYRLAGREVGAVNLAEVTYRADGEIRRVRSETAVIACLAPCREQDRHPDVFEWERELRDKLGVVASDNPAEPTRTAKPTAAPSARIGRARLPRRWHSG